MLTFAVIFFIVAFIYVQLNSKKEMHGLEDPSRVLSWFNKGFCLDGKKKLDIKSSVRHSVVIGQSGSGKTQCTFLPTLLRSDKSISFVVHDPSGEIREKVSPHFLMKGYSIKVINLANPSHSHAYNPLKRIDKSYASAKQLANIIVSSSLGQNSNDSFWNIKGEHVLAVCIAFTKQLEKRFHHMGTVLKLLNSLSSNPVGVDFMFAEKCKDEKLFEEYKTIASTDSKLMSNILATAKASISIFEDESIMSLCSNDDIQFEDLRTKPTIIFLQSSIMKLRYHAPLFSLVLTQLMEELISKLPGKSDRTVFMCLDEMGVLNLPHFSDFLSNCRKYRIGCMLGCQTTDQIVSKYGKEEGNNILSNCYTSLYFSNQPITTCKILEQMGGYYEEENEGRVERKLTLPAHEIRTLHSNQAILMVGGMKPMKLDLLPAYESMLLSRRMKLFSEGISFPQRNADIADLYIPIPKKTK
ncbi:MAG: type IV secretory system conjugative DNA transfer family protein [Bacteroidetes bacterium]|nr:type IV secretory system conjugative DNA transfer family protein [Bacteroidota bacterium]